MVPTMTEVEGRVVVMGGALLGGMASGTTDLAAKDHALRVFMGSLQAVTVQAVGVPMVKQSTLATNSPSPTMLLSPSSRALRCHRCKVECLPRSLLSWVFDRNLYPRRLL
jgi:hypothetical protein